MSLCEGVVRTFLGPVRDLVIASATLAPRFCASICRSNGVEANQISKRLKRIGWGLVPHEKQAKADNYVSILACFHLFVVGDGQ